MNGCSNSISLVGLSIGSILKQTSKNDLAYFDIPEGNWGGDFESLITLKICFGLFPNSVQGGIPVNISITRQPKLHISAAKEYPYYFTTSGAIQ
jgi:hypothetical protein